jgi:hypothetical protein
MTYVENLGADQTLMSKLILLRTSADVIVWLDQYLTDKTAVMNQTPAVVSKMLEFLKKHKIAIGMKCFDSSIGREGEG